MQCEECHQHEATVHIQEIVGERKISLHLCAACAATKGVKPGNLQGVDLVNLLLTLAKKEKAKEGVAPPAAAEPETRAPCPGCGLTAADFRAHGRLGCAECYTAFADLLAPLLHALHRGTRHRGRRPGPAAAVPAAPDRELSRLEGALARAVAEEDYEEAATLRDAIRRCTATTARRTPPREST